MAGWWDTISSFLGGGDDGGSWTDWVQPFTQAVSRANPMGSVMRGSVSHATGRPYESILRDVSQYQMPEGYGALSKVYERYPQQADVDKRLHAYISHLMSQRYGRYPTMGAGIAKEIADIPASGFDWQDLLADWYGTGLE